MSSLFPSEPSPPFSILGHWPAWIALGPTLPSSLQWGSPWHTGEASRCKGMEERKIRHWCHRLAASFSQRPPLALQPSVSAVSVAGGQWWLSDATTQLPHSPLFLYQSWPHTFANSPLQYLILIDTGYSSVHLCLVWSNYSSISQRFRLRNKKVSMFKSVWQTGLSK